MELGPSTRVLITGASRGIGLACARAFSEHGCPVALVARTADELEQAAEQLPGPAAAIPADVSSSAEVQRAIDRCVSQLGGLEVVIANAGIAHYGPLLDVDPESAERMVSVNVLGTLHTVRAAGVALRDHGGGSLVVVSSGAGLRAFPSAAVYGGTKAFGRGLAEALGHEFAPHGITVTTVYPGEIDTGLHDHERERMPDWYKGETLPPSEVAERIVEAVRKGSREVHVPKEVRLLGANGLAPGLVDRLLRRLRGRSAAPGR
ncbi:MAG: SDR family NAD(P)-dependent oxidoreductase [Solirubrobacterales bacterium]